MNNYSYTYWLKDRVDDASLSKKSIRTRAQLKVATSELLNDTPYQNLHITQICKQANVGSGTFYRYFNGKKEITEEILEDVINQFSKLMSKAGKNQSGHSMFDLFTEANLTFFKFAAANQGIYRCLLQASDQEYELGTIIENSTASWSVRVTSSIIKNNQHLNEACTLTMVNCLASMLNDIAARLTFRKDHTLGKLFKKNEMNEENAARFLAVLWHRLIFGCDPDGHSAEEYFEKNKIQ